MAAGRRRMLIPAPAIRRGAPIVIGKGRLTDPNESVGTGGFAAP